MNEQRARVFEDLRGLIEGDLAFTDIERAAYRGDAGPWEDDPLCVVAPRNERDLAQLLQYATENALTVHPRGAGTGSSGCCTGPGIVVDLSRYFRRLELVGDSVTAGAGAVIDHINARLATQGRRLAVALPYPESATIGGAIACDAHGQGSLLHGPLADHVESVLCVFAGGERGTLHPGFRPSEGIDAPSHVEIVGRRIHSLMAHAAERGTGLASAGRPSAGYRFDALRGTQGIDLARLMCGSFGSLAVITQVQLRTVPIPAARSVVVAIFGRMADAAEAVARCVSARAASCDLFDGRLISLAREADAIVREHVAETPEAAIVVGFEGDDTGLVADRARRLADRLAMSGRLLHEPIEVHRRADVIRLLALRRTADDRLSRGRDARRPLVPWDEIVVAPAALPSLLVRLQALFRREGVPMVLDALAGLGRARLRPMLDLRDPLDRERVVTLGDAVREIALQLDGVAGAGQGPQRSAWLRRFQGDRLNLEREIKYAFDPLGILNPGAVASTEGTGSTHRLRGLPRRQTVDTMVETTQAGSLVLRWPERSRAEHLAACTNCGACRTQEPSLRMCPVFRASRDEAASPRAKVNLLNQIASGQIDPRSWGTDEVRDHASLCVHCRLCEPECPAGVDVSSLMLEAKAGAVANHGLSPEEWVLSRIDSWSALSSRFPRVYDALSTWRWSRWLLERTFGLSRHRVLPKAARGSFVKRAERWGLTRPNPQAPGPRAVYFLDIFANYYDPEVAESTVAVLRHLGVNVYVPTRQRGCGMPALVTGDLDYARELVSANLRILGNAVRDGYTVICTEPTALLMLKQEAPRLTDDLDASLVANNALDAGQYVLGLLQRGDVPQPSVALHGRAGYHQPCHLRAVGAGTPALDLLRHIPGLETTFIDQGCSGMAGIYGLARRHFRSSLRAGRGLRRRLRGGDIQFGTTECATCRMQMEQGISKRTVHPMKLLALAYGLDPDLRRHITDPKPRGQLSG